MKSIQVSDELHERIMNLKEPYKKHLEKSVKDVTITAPIVISTAIMMLEQKLGIEDAHN